MGLRLSNYFTCFFIYFLKISAGLLQKLQADVGAEIRTAPVIHCSQAFGISVNDPECGKIVYLLSFFYYNFVLVFQEIPCRRII